MTNLLIKTELIPLVIDLSSVVPNSRITDEQFVALCQANQDLRLERTAQGEVIIMPPASAGTSYHNMRIAQQVVTWADRDGTGVVFDSSAGFTLPNGAIRGPDVSWIKRERWEALSEDQQYSFAPICPDFVIELRSPSDTLAGLQEKMQEYIDNGVQLGLLIDRKNRKVYRYRPGCQPEILTDPSEVSCDPELPGFSLQMTPIG